MNFYLTKTKGTNFDNWTLMNSGGLTLARIEETCRKGLWKMNGYNYSSPEKAAKAYLSSQKLYGDLFIQM